MTRYLSASVLMLTALAVWLTFGEGSQLPALTTLSEQTSLNGSPTNYRQGYLQEGTLWRYNENGQREQTLRVASAEQFTESDTQYLTQLHFEGVDTEGDLWIMTSEAGELRADGSELLLTGDVRITDTRAGSVLNTTDLTIFPDQKIATNEAPVTLTSATSRTQAEGLTVDFEDGTATLKRKVETVYEP